MSTAVSRPPAERGPALQAACRAATFLERAAPGRRACDALFVLVLAVVCAVTLYTGVVQTHIYGHDIFFFLDNGWRALHGQRPYLDYYSPWGPVTFLAMAAGLRLAGGNPDAIAWAGAILGVTAALWGYALARRRLAPLLAVLFGVSLMLLSVATFPLGNPPSFASHAMAYNRYGFAFLSLVLLECLGTVRGGGRSGGASTGAALAVLLFLKASYFFAALPLVALSTLYDARRERWRAMAAAAGLVTLGFLMYLRFDVADMLRDLRMAAGARGGALSWTRLGEVVGGNALWGLLLPGTAALELWSSWSGAGRGTWKSLGEELWPVLLTAAVFLMGCLLIASNAQTYGLPLTAGAALLMLDEAWRRLRATRDFERQVPVFLTVLALGGAVWLAASGADAAGVAGGAWRKWRNPDPAVARFDAPRLAHLFLFEPARGSARGNGRAFVAYVNDGLRLLRADSRPEETIFTMDMTNPFPYALGRPPMEGGIATAAWNYCLSARYHPSADRLFGNADILMIPKHPAIDDQWFDGYVEFYRADIDRRFRLAAESDWWWMYRRKR